MRSRFSWRAHYESERYGTGHSHVPSLVFVQRPCIGRSLYNTFWLTVAIVVFTMAGRSLWAQQAIQQPVIGVTSINTTVSVPDRGSTYLGGVSSAQSGRSQYGPLRSGASTGFNRQSTSIITQVHIIDLEEMDRAILNSSPTETGTQRRPGNIAAIRPQPQATYDVKSTTEEKARRFEELAHNAEKTDKPKVARLYWEAAAKHGSRSAEKRLRELTRHLPNTTTESSIVARPPLVRND